MPWTQLYVTSPDAPPESSTPHDALAPTELVEVKAEHDKPDETQDVPRAEQDAYSPPQDASTPQPESVGQSFETVPKQQTSLHFRHW